ncbi:MXAN_6230/SCO0854 family RING domain-containing protein [Streptomyces sp. MUM 203J]|uniref:MXAN_6230/SCO0854 family RING domain-containing protein n=1 Tax=Streptomyces sp. MUM 203J TaxID=2791990 RepID=UPI001F03713C|nr:MXAN_6230/SCO0854 family RING domain-containing protein [Streptomyces sp. MUM 203J]
MSVPGPLLEAVLLRRLRTVYVDAAAPRPGDPSTAEGLAALEAELLDRGFAPGRRLRDALARLGPAGLAEAGKRLLVLLDAELGADRTHTPLFRGFPHSVPDDTFQLYVDRVFTLLLQAPDQPCVLCGTVGSVRPVTPCAHLVCRGCWDGGDYSGCPLCHRRIDGADPFLKPSPVTRSPEVPARPLQPLDLGSAGPAADAARTLGVLLARRTPLSPQDRDDLKLLVGHAPAALDWLPRDVPVRESKALVLGRLLLAPRTRDAVTALLPEQLTTATDVLRLLAVLSGGEADLLAPPRFRTPRRGLRRTLLRVLDGLPVDSLVEDLLRHPVLWKRAGESLHPFEWHARHPRAALAFALVRGTDLDSVSFGDALRATAAEHPAAVRIEGTRLRARTWGGRVEAALSGGDPDGALLPLAERPGELLRRLDQLLRLYGEAGPGPEALRRIALHIPHAGAGPLLAAYGRLRARHLPGHRRVFFPRGQVARSYAVDDTRPPLPAAVTRRVCGLLEAEALRRLVPQDRADRYRLAVLDTGLAGVAVPSAQSGTAKAAVSVPRGSTLPLPPGEVLRLFLHWTQPPRTRVDLDLSAALYGADWSYRGLCDYTRLVYGKRAAVHSGDLTSAPAPDGATEYVDLDLAALREAGVRFVVPTVLSFDDIPFDQLPDVFAGFMSLSSRGGRGSAYDPRTVRQRYDLAGESRVQVPLLADLEERTFLWTDVHLSSSGGHHSVGRHRTGLGRIGEDLSGYFASGRTTLWDVAVWHAAARAEETVVVRDGELLHYTRRLGETLGGFARRIRTGGEPDLLRQADSPAAEAGRAASHKRVLLALVDGDVAPEGASGTVYRLLPGAVDGCGLAQAAAGDLVAELG